jgi:hypothetical protein
MEAALNADLPVARPDSTKEVGFFLTGVNVNIEAKPAAVQQPPSEISSLETVTVVDTMKVLAPEQCFFISEPSQIT